MRKAIILCALLCAAGIAARADIQQDVINRDPAGASGGGGGSVTVGESDGSPSVSDVSTISFNQSQGFTVTDEGGGEAEVGLSLGAAMVLYDDTNDGYPAGVLNVEDALDALVNEPVGGPNSEDSIIPFENLKNVPAFRKTLFQLRPQGYYPPTSSFATMNTRNNIPVLRFNGNVCAIWALQMPNTYGGNGVTVRFEYTSTETSGDTDWDGSWRKLSGVDIDTATFATAVSSDNNSNNATSGIPTVIEISFTDGAQMDNCGAEDWCEFRLCRDDASDTGGADTIDYGMGAAMETP